MWVLVSQGTLVSSSAHASTVNTLSCSLLQQLETFQRSTPCTPAALQLGLVLCDHPQVESWWRHPEGQATHTLPRSTTLPHTALNSTRLIHTPPVPPYNCFHPSQGTYLWDSFLLNTLLSVETDSYIKSQHKKLFKKIKPVLRKGKKEKVGFFMKKWILSCPNWDLTNLIPVLASTIHTQKEI